MNINWKYGNLSTFNPHYLWMQEVEMILIIAIKGLVSPPPLIVLIAKAVLTDGTKYHS